MKTTGPGMIAVVLIGLVGTADADFAPVYTFPQSGQSNFNISNYSDSRTDELADFDGDGSPDVFPENGATLSIVKLTGTGFTPTELWTYTLPETPDFVNLLAAELAPDAGKEVLVDWGTWTGGSHVLVISAAGSLVWDFGNVPLGDLADFNGDGLEDVVIGDVSSGGFTIWSYVAGPAGVRATDSNVLNLRQNTPNPFNPVTRVAFDLAIAGPTTMEIFDIRGHQVWSRSLGTLVAGTHEVTWDGNDRENHRLPSGAYFYRLISGDWTQTKKMIMLK